MAGTFSGGWMRKQFQVTPPELLHQADDRHAVNELGDPQTAAYGAPPILGSDPAPYMPEYIPEDVAWVVQTPGGFLDVTPWVHTEGSPNQNQVEYFTQPGYAAPGDVAMQRASGAAHSIDYGGSVNQNSDIPPYQSYDERYLSDRIEGVGPVGDLIPALSGGGQRGLNGLSVNNPPLEMYGGRGYRYGWTEQFWVDRKMYDPTRQHDERLNLANTADFERDAPVPADPNAYNSPFSVMARGITNTAQRPFLRRVPPSLDSSVIDDGSNAYAPYDGADGWVVG